ncbi:MAG TPA: hypothetical protein PK530_04890 [Anaerolineales bacterium]|nr:hypothetical protein [Anaerolineales bacterium]
MTAEIQPKKKRVDGQITGLAGEFFVAAELLKRNLQVSVTFGNAKSIDLFAFNETVGEHGRTYNVQVKAVRYRNFFPLRRAAIHPEQVYVFVILNPPGKSPDYFIAWGWQLLEYERTTRGIDALKFPGIHYGDLEPFRDQWEVFEG